MESWLDKGFRLHADQCRRMAVAFAFALPLSTSLTEICGALLVVHWLFSGEYRAKWDAVRRTPAVWVMAGFFGLFLVGIVYGPASWDVAWDATFKQRKLFYAIPLLTMLTTWPDRLRVIRGFQAGMLATLLFSYLHWAGVDSIASLSSQAGNGAPFKNYLAHSILMGFFAYTLILDWKRQPRRGWVIGPLLALAAYNVLAMVPARTGYILLALLVVVALYQTVSRKQFAVGLVAIALVCAGSLLYVPKMQGRVNQAKQEFLAWLHATKPEQQRTSIGLRLTFYEYSLELARQRPWLGWGTGGLEAKFQEDGAENGPMRGFQNPHNLYLYHLVEHGLVGLAWLLAMFGIQFRDSRHLPAAERFLARGVLALMTVGSLANSLLLDITEGTLFVLIIGVCWAAHPRLAAGEQTESAASDQPLPHRQAA